MMVIKMKQKTKQKRGWYGVENKINEIKRGTVTGGPL